MSVSKSFQYGSHTVTLDTGELARQANGAVRVSMGDTVVLVTVCAQKSPAAGRDFLPLTVNYVEKTYAAGRIPGGFFKREGRPSEKETLTSRLIDRPIRPLFPDGFFNDVQVVATVVSLDPQIDPDIAALLGASAALALSGIPPRRRCSAVSRAHRSARHCGCASRPAGAASSGTATAWPSGLPPASSNRWSPPASISSSADCSCC